MINFSNSVNMKWCAFILGIIACFGLFEICSTVAIPNESVWSYQGQVKVKNVASDGTDPVAAIWTISSKVLFQRFEKYSVTKITKLSTKIYNGKESDHDKYEEQNISEDSPIFKPIVVDKTNMMNLSIRHEADDPVWSVNLKRGIITSFIVNQNKDLVDGLVSKEQTLYGKCSVSYSVNEKKPTLKIVEKTIDYESCKKNPSYDYSNKAWDPSVSDHKPFKVESVYHYTYNPEDLLIKVESDSEMRYQSMPAVRSAQVIEQKKILERLSTTTDAFDPIDTSKNIVTAGVIFDYSKGLFGGSENDIKHSDEKLLNEFKENFQSFKESFNQVPLKHYNIFDNDTVTNMFNALWEMKSTEFEKIMSDKDVNRQQMFLSLLPYLGTNSSLEFIKKIIENDDENLNDLLAIKILAQFPMYVEDYGIELLTNMLPLTHLKNVKNEQLKYAGILSFANLVQNTYRAEKITKIEHKNYLQIYVDNFRKTDDYELKMTYLLGIANIGGNYYVDEILHILSDTNLDHHLRALGIYSFRNMLFTASEKLFAKFWPMVTNETEHYEIRTLALDTILYSSISEENFQKVVQWYDTHLYDTKNMHVTHYLYTTMQALDNSTGYYEEAGSMATEVLQTMKPHELSQLWTSSNYRMAFTDADSNFGGSLQARLISNPNTNVITTGIFSLNNFAISLNLASYTAYIKIDNLIESAFFDFYYRNDNPDDSLIELIRKHGYKYINWKQDFHIEFVLFSDDKTMFAMHINKDNIANYTDNPLLLDLLSLLVDYNSLSYPLMDYTYLISDLGTGIKVSNDISEISFYGMKDINQFFSIASNEDNSSGEDDDTLNVNLMYRTMFDYSVTSECYNPLISTSASTYKYFRYEEYFDLPFQFNFSTNDYLVSWKHKKDSFNMVSDHLIGTFVENDKTLKKYCHDCSMITSLGEENFTSTELALKPILGIKFNITSLSKTKEQIYLDALTPPKIDDRLSYFVNQYKNNLYCPDYAVPILFIWHIVTYSTFVYPDIARFEVRTLPYYDEPTETIFNLDLDADELKSDKDPISGSEFDFSVKLTNRKSDSKDVIDYLNITYVYKSKSMKSGSEKQPHFEDNMNIRIFYSNVQDPSNHLVCVNRDVFYPQRNVDKFSITPVGTTKAITYISYGNKIETIDDTCPEQEKMVFTEIYKASENLKNKIESMAEYEKCIEQKKGKKYIPPTMDCLKLHEIISEYDTCDLYGNFSKMSLFSMLPHSKEYGVHLMHIYRVNDTEAYFELTDEMLEVLNAGKPNPLLKMNGTLPLDSLDIMSLSPNVIAYEDYDLLAGISSPCHIVSDEIVSFHGYIHKNYSDDATAFVDCINETQNGLTIQKFAKKLLGFTFWTNYNKLEVKIDDGKMKILLNNEEQKKNDNKEISVDKLKVYYLDEDALYVTNGLVDIQYTMEYITIKAPNIYNNFICGLCNTN